MVEISAEIQAANPGIAMHNVRRMPSRLRYEGHRLSNIPFLVAIGGIAVWSALALLYRITN